EGRTEAVAISADAGVADGLLAVSSLSRAMDGSARLADLGALLWMILPQILPCDSFAIFIPDPERDEVAVRYAAGVNAQRIRGVSRATGTGVAGWVAVNRRPAVNAEAGIDLGTAALGACRPLRSCLAAPLVSGEDLVAIVALYSATAQAYADDHVRLLDLLAPRLASALDGVAAVEFDAPQTALAPALKLVTTRRV